MHGDLVFFIVNLMHGGLIQFNLPDTGYSAEAWEWRS